MWQTYRPAGFDGNSQIAARGLSCASLMRGPNFRQGECPRVWGPGALVRQVQDHLHFTAAGTTRSMRMISPRRAAAPMADLTDEQRRALRILARSPNGCTVALMLAYRFTDDTLAELMVNGLLTARYEHAVGRAEMVVRMQITAAGRREIGE
jgi:hypothetical protein